ncbi:MAG TPA: GGDEF domain-containing protein [Burkholderiales bacterium]|jgi:diguanylate cyclase (GGDEF)-like protein|nr:GGDEF domain-containing protein [Burkholderiales bacterium]
MVIIGHHGASRDLSASSPASRAALNFAAPAGVLGLALLLAEHLPDRPGALSALRAFGPALVLFVGALVSLAFRRGRALFAILSLAVAYAVLRFLLHGEASGFVARTLGGAAAILVPLNIAVYSLVQERGALNVYGLRRGALILFECLLVLVLLDRQTEITDLIFYPLFGALSFWDARLPQLALPVTALALLVTGLNATIRNAPIDAAFCGAIVAFAVASAALSAPEGLAIYVAAAGGMITVGVLQDSYRMAFHDELTGLPGRRALNERMLSLAGRYTIAMVDVDHFKSFNDRWGHDVGDQVLKLVASRLRHPGRGGQAYRYGGEEFALLFPGRRLLEVLPRLQSLRRDIENYRFLIREGRRVERDSPKARAAMPADAPRTPASVTVSVGVAERNEHQSTPGEVLKAADAALYRAKAEGRNRICRWPSATPLP